MSKTRRISHRRPQMRRNLPNLEVGVKIKADMITASARNSAEQLLLQQELLRRLAKAYGYTLIADDHFAHNARYRYFIVKNGTAPQKWIWTMLHEIGHAELNMLRYKPQIKSNVLRGLILKLRHKPTAAYYKNYLRMEWGAWQQGFKIAERLGITLHEEQYWEHARYCYQTYVQNLRNNTWVGIEWDMMYMKARKEARKKWRKKNRQHLDVEVGQF